MTRTFILYMVMSLFWVSTARAQLVPVSGTGASASPITTPALPALLPSPAPAATMDQTDIDVPSPATNQDKTRPSTATQIGIRYATLVLFPTAVTVYGQQTWDWGEQRSWQWGDEGFFGENTGLGGADKMGHAWACYVLMRGSHAIFDYTENGRPAALWYATAVAALIGTGIEVGDAFNGKYGFAWQDIVADYSGIALGMLLDSVPAADALLSFSAFYWPTQGFLDYPEKTVLNIEGDTSGWSYMLNLKAAGLDHVGVNVPSYLRYFMLDVGYFTRGFTPYDESAGNMDRARYWFMGVSLNVPEVLDTLFQGSGSRANRMVRAPFNYYHLPIGVSHASAVP